MLAQEFAVLNTKDTESTEFHEGGRDRRSLLTRAWKDFYFWEQRFLILRARRERCAREFLARVAKGAQGTQIAVTLT